MSIQAIIRVSVQTSTLILSVCTGFHVGSLSRAQDRLRSSLSAFAFQPSMLDLHEWEMKMYGVEAGLQ